MKTNWRGMAVALLAGGLAGAATGGQVRLGAAAAHPVLEAGRKQTTYIKVGLTGFEIENQARRAPVNIAIALDRSGSMSGEKIRRAREAAVNAIERLDRRDIIAVVAYDDGVNVISPATRADDMAGLRERIMAIEPGGSTALFAGVGKAAEETRKFLDRGRVNRVILISDGLANVGPASPGELADLGASLAKEGISVTTIGLGLGYNEDLMTRLAKAADGNHAFVENSRDLAGIFDREFGDVLSVVAKDVTIRIDCAEGVRPVRVLGREGEIAGQRVTAAIQQIYSKQEKYILLEVEVPARADGTTMQLAQVSVSYANLGTDTTDHLTSTVGARFSADRELVEKSQDRDVMVAATLQVAAADNRMAVKLRDEGRVEEARRTLMDNAGRLRAAASSLASPELRKYGEANALDADSLEGAKWDSRRKQMRKDQYSIEAQQAW